MAPAVPQQNPDQSPLHRLRLNSSLPHFRAQLFLVSVSLHVSAPKINTFIHQIHAFINYSAPDFHFPLPSTTLA